MKLDVDTKERIKVLLIFLLQSYKVAMGSMLVLFVPQLCDDGVCSITDNLNKCSNHFHKLASSLMCEVFFPFYHLYISKEKRIFFYQTFVSLNIFIDSLLRI